MSEDGWDEAKLLRAELQKSKSRILELEGLIEWLTQTVHQAHHQDDGPLEGCPKAICAAVRQLAANDDWPDFTTRIHRAHQ